MTNPINRVKLAVTKRKTQIVYGAGVATGIAGAFIVQKKFPAHIVAPIDTKQLQHLIDNPEDAMNYIEFKTGRRITLFNDVHVKK